MSAPSTSASPSTTTTTTTTPKQYDRVSIKLDNPTMQYVNLGDSGLRVSRISLGCMSFGAGWKLANWVLPEEESRAIIHRALQLGINFFDTANMYSNGVSEEYLGRAIRDFAVRDQIVIATKVCLSMGEGPHEGGLSRKHILASVNDSLRRLGVDYIDLLQLHRPDNNTPIEETMEVLNDLVKQGKVLYIGVSSWFGYQLSKAHRIAERRNLTKFISNQNLYNLLYREEEREIVPLCEDDGVSLCPWSPLAAGMLTGTRVKGESKEGKPIITGDTHRGGNDIFINMVYGSDADWSIVEKVKEIAAQKKCTSAQVALAWLLSKPIVASPIVGVTKLYQLEEAVESLKVKLTEDEIKNLEELYKAKAIVGQRPEHKLMFKRRG